MKYQRHPISARYPDITGNAWIDFKENLRARLAAGKKIGRKVILFEDKVLDGWQLYRACCELEVEPEFAQFPKNEDPVAYVETVNEHRRHEDQNAMNLRLAARRERIAQALAGGQSTREIAKKEGISQRQVVKDSGHANFQGKVQSSGVSTGTQSGNSASGETEGENESAGTPILCKRCARVGAVKDCPKCSEQRAARPTKRKGGGKRKRTARLPKEDNGFADASLTKAIVKVRALVAERQSAFGDHLECAHILDHLNMLSACWERWQQETKGEIAKGPAVFQKPTLQEVMDFCAERHSPVDPEAFMDYYNANGWKIGGKAPMKDWKSAVRNWERNNGKRGRDENSRVGRVYSSASDRAAFEKKHGAGSFS